MVNSAWDWGLNVRSEGTRTASLFATSDSLGAWDVINEAAGDPALVSLVDQTLLFRPSMIIGLGFERRFTGTTGLAVGLRYNMALRNQYQAFPIYQTRTGNEFLFEFDENTGVEEPVSAEMKGKTGQIELCVGVMFLIGMNTLIQHIVSWLQEYARTANMNGWVVGVSGGIDSAVTSTLCAETGLPTCVVEMPIHQHPSQVSRAQAHMQALEARFENVSRARVDLTTVYDGLVAALPEADDASSPGWPWPIQGRACG